MSDPARAEWGLTPSLLFSRGQGWRSRYREGSGFFLRFTFFFQVVFWFVDSEPGSLSRVTDCCSSVAHRFFQFQGQPGRVWG